MSRSRRVRTCTSRRSGGLGRWWSLVAAAVAATALVSAAPATAVVTGATWPANRFDLARTGANPSETVISPANASTLALDWRVAGGFRSSPVVSQGVAYLSCDTAAVCALDPVSGRMLWRTTVGTTYRPMMPVVSGGIVYVVWSRPATLTALNASTGAVLWSTQIAPDGSDLMGPPVVADGLVFLSSSADVLHAVDAATGARRWATPATMPSSPAYAGGVLYVGGGFGPNAVGGTIWALRAATGEVLWKRGASSSNALTSPMLHGGRIYVGLSNGYFSAPSPSFAAFGLAACAAGPCQPQWTYTSPLGFSGLPAASGGVVYQASYDGYLHALNASTGQLLWEGATTGAGSGSWPGPPTVANGLVFASGDDGYVYAWPTKGCSNAICPPLWVGDVGGRTQQHVSGSEATVVDGRLYVVTSAGVLSSFSPRPSPAPPRLGLELSTVRSWGLGNVGQLGTGSIGDSRAPRLATGVAGVTKLSGGGFHTLAVRKDGSASGWGWNREGQSDGGISDSPAALRYSNNRDVVDVAAGLVHSLVVTGPEGTVWAMGSNRHGAHGTGPDLAGGRVVVPGISGARSVAAGGMHSLAVKADGTVWAWGSNVLGQLGDGSTVDRVRPLQVPGLTGVVAVSAGLYHSLALKGDGTVWAWGWNGVGALGTGQAGDIGVRPAPVGGLADVRSVSAGGLHSLAATGDGRVWAWGSNGFGQLGTGRGVTVARKPALVPLAGVTSVAAGGYHSLALTADGSVRSWGWNRYGQLGTGSATDSAFPVRVRGLGDATAISGGWAHSAAAGP